MARLIGGLVSSLMEEIIVMPRCSSGRAILRPERDPSGARAGLIGGGGDRSSGHLKHMCTPFTGVNAVLTSSVFPNR